MVNAVTDNYGNVTPLVPAGLNWVGTYASGSYLVGFPSGTFLTASSTVADVYVPGANGVLTYAVSATGLYTTWPISGTYLTSGNYEGLTQYYYQSGTTVPNSGYAAGLAAVCGTLGLNYGQVTNWQVT